MINHMRRTDDPELEAETDRMAKARDCDRGTFTVCWGEHERGEVCRCKEDAQKNLERNKR